MRASVTATVFVLAIVMALTLNVTAQAVKITNGPVIETATGNSATVAWSTNQASDSRVWYGTERGNINKVAEAPGAATTHRVQINNLQPNTTYYFQVESHEGKGGPDTESQGVMSFHTAAAGQAPIHNEKAAVADKGLANEENGSVKLTGGPTLEYVDANTATIAWSTNLKGSTRVTYGQDPNNLTQLAEAPWGAGGLTHRVKIQNLQPNTTYYFQVETGQAQGTGGAEVEAPRVMSFKTTAAGAPPLRNQPAH
jgi:phosphodiesterase/alkaline phosphatase D-like protein